MSNGYALLVGNGLNRAEGMVNWNDLLKDVAEQNELSSITVNQDVPATIQFEALITKKFHNKNNGTESKNINRTFSEVKKGIVNRFNAYGLNINFNDIRIELFKALKPSVVLTTNYDDLLSSAYKEVNRKHKVSSVNNNERKYNLYRYSQIDNTFFYYIHGSCAKPDSIVLGYEHYAGTISKLRNAINPVINNYITNDIDDYSNILSNDSVKKFYEEHLVKRNIKKDIQLLKNKNNLSEIDIFGYRNNKVWMNHFFKKDIYIMGLGLDYSEIDLWWLLVYRSYLSNLTNRMNAIYYLDTKATKDDEKQKNKHRIFEELGVTVKSFYLDESGSDEPYKEAYHEMISYIKGKVNE